MSSYIKIRDKDGSAISQYRESENANRKANRTGDSYEHVGQNKVAHQWTTSGSSIQQAHANKVAREQKLKNKQAPVKTFTPEEKAAMQANFQNKGTTVIKSEEELTKRAPKSFSADKKKKHESCVMDLKDEGKSVGSAHAICTSALKKDDTKYADLPSKCPSCSKAAPVLKGHTNDVEPLTWWHCPSCETTGVARLPKNIKKGEGGTDDVLIKTHPDAYEVYCALEELKKRYVGFEKLKAKLADKGAADPGALAAAIGRKKYGKKAMANAAAKGKKMNKADEPHADDPHHEEKEQEAASKIKEKAQQILDLHKK